MDAIVFDFDGVVVDSEPVHFAAFRDVLATLGVELTREQYYGRYLGYDDWDCFSAVLTDSGRGFSEADLERLIEAKSNIVADVYAECVEPISGSIELIRSVHNSGTPMAICSGALRHEIELAARKIGVWSMFSAVVAAEDVRFGKPDPQGYRLALEALGKLSPKGVRSGRCAAVEDSPAGIAAARGAGMKVLAVCTSYAADALHQADKIVPGPSAVTLADLEAMLAGSAGGA